MRSIGLGLWVCLSVAPAVACGGESASCGKTEPCGGDVVGTWVPHVSCVSRASLQSRYMSQLGGECPSGSAVSVFDATSDWATVSSTFNADGSYSGTRSFSATVQILVPTACLVTRSCADLDANLRGMIDPATGIVAGSCRSADTACACSVSQQQPTVAESGTYTTSGTVLTTTPAGGTATETPYCVRGSELHLLSIDTTAGTQTIANDIVLARR